LEFRILGPIEVIDGGAPLDLGTHRQRALLALLVMNAQATT
jgi:DNA-binding SARP family transcriptional activator